MRDVTIEVRMSFGFTHYGREDQLETVRLRLERELFLALSRPVGLTIDSVISTLPQQPLPFPEVAHAAL